jgi:hypothetical protein
VPPPLKRCYMGRPKKVVQVEPATESEFNFFTEADFNRKGQVASMVPAWACYQLIEELERDIEMKERQAEDFSISPEKRAKLLTDISVRKERLEQVNTKPKLDSDKIFKTVGSDRSGGSLGNKISESMFSYDDMQKGIADAAVELRRSTEPCIKLEGDEIEMAKGANVTISKEGKVSRDDAIRTWRFGRLYLEDLSNSEVLRRN